LSSSNLLNPNSDAWTLNPQLPTKLFNSNISSLHLRIKLLQFLRHGLQVNFFFFFKGIYIARYVQVVIVLVDLFQSSRIAELVFGLTCFVGINNLIDILWP